MKKIYQLQIDFMNMVLRFMIGFSAIGIAVLIIEKDPACVYRSLWLIPASVITFLINMKMKRVLSYSAFLLILMAIYLTGYWKSTGDLLMTVLCCCFILVNAVLQLYSSTKERRTNINWLHFFIIILMYLICLYLYNRDLGLNQFYLIFSLIYCLLYIINTYFVNANDYMNEHEDSSSIPFHQIKVSQGFSLTVITVICVIVMFLSTLIPVPIPDLHLNRSLPHAKYIYEQKSKVDMMRPVPKELEGNGKSSIILEYAAKVMYVLVSAAVIVLLAYLLFKAIIKLYKLLGYKKTETRGNQTEFLSPFKKRQIDINRDRKLKYRGFFAIFGQSNSDKIRKQYYKAVLNHAKQDQPLNYLMPAQLSKCALASGEQPSENTEKQDNEIKLTSMYEKARYSESECSADEVQLVKNLIHEAGAGRKK